jgi:putative acetyltransferase
MKIRPALLDDRATVLAIEAAAFGRLDEAKLVADLLDDPTAQPVISPLAEVDGVAVGHVPFTAARVVEDDAVVPASLLAPLAVAPEAQRRGVGLALILAGVDALAALDVGLIFVLGHIDYYPRAGFRLALPFGLRAPYAIDPAVADAWMVRTTRRACSAPYAVPCSARMPSCTRRCGRSRRAAACPGRRSVYPGVQAARHRNWL